MLSSYSTLAPLLKSGKVRLRVVTSKQSHPTFADLPPLAPAAMAPAAFAARVKDELGQWKRIATERKIVAE
jgi:tripartite-type tricarboxylate transporter receptor subunit TctC